jgi:hypothetical protein
MKFWILDADLAAVESAFPYLGKTAAAGRVMINSGEIARNRIRRWQDRMIATYGSQFV